jgi:hypothetical protein
VAVLDADSYIRERAVRGRREKFDRVLAKVPDGNLKSMIDFLHRTLTVKE